MAFWNIVQISFALCECHETFGANYSKSYKKFKVYTFFLADCAVMLTFVRI